MRCPHCGQTCWVGTDLQPICWCQSETICVVCNSEVPKGKEHRTIVQRDHEMPHIIHTGCRAAWERWYKGAAA